MNTPALKYEILTACYSFKCPVCGKRIKPGDNYLRIDLADTCLCQMPARRLKPLTHKIEAA